MTKKQLESILQKHSGKSIFKSINAKCENGTKYSLIFTDPDGIEQTYSDGKKFISFLKRIYAKPKSKPKKQKRNR